MWDLPRSGVEPVSPAVAGGFFTISTTWEAQKCGLEAGIPTDKNDPVYPYLGLISPWASSLKLKTHF